MTYTVRARCAHKSHCEFLIDCEDIGVAVESLGTIHNDCQVKGVEGCGTGLTPLSCELWHDDGLITIGSIEKECLCDDDLGIVVQVCDECEGRRCEARLLEGTIMSKGECLCEKENKAIWRVERY